jgi:hypothetical protein
MSISSTSRSSGLVQILFLLHPLFYSWSFRDFKYKKRKELSKKLNYKRTLQTLLKKTHWGSLVEKKHIKCLTSQLTHTQELFYSRKASALTNSSDEKAEIEAEGVSNVWQILPFNYPKNIVLQYFKLLLHLRWCRKNVSLTLITSLHKLMKGERYRMVNENFGRKNPVLNIYSIISNERYQTTSVERSVLKSWKILSSLPVG